MADDDDAAPVDRVVSSIDSPGSTATARDDEPPVAVVDVDDNNNNEPGTPLEFTPTQMGYWLCRDARLPAMRQQLAGFGGLATLVLAGPDYARFWPYVSNVWNRNASRNKLSADALRVARVEYFQCKFRREWKPKGSGLRSSVSTTVSPCLAYLKVTTEFEALDGEPTDRVERVRCSLPFSPKSLHTHISVSFLTCAAIGHPRLFARPYQSRPASL